MYAAIPSPLSVAAGTMAPAPDALGVAELTSAQLSTQTTLSTTAQSRGARNTVAGADAEIARFKEILRQIDELEMEFDKVRHIRDIVKGFRARVEGVGRALDRRR